MRDLKDLWDSEGKANFRDWWGTRWDNASRLDPKRAHWVLAAPAGTDAAENNETPSIGGCNQHKSFLSGHSLIRGQSLTPIHIKHAATLAALKRHFAHGVINRHSQHLAAVWALNFRGASDGSREAELVVDELVEEGH